MTPAIRHGEQLLLLVVLCVVLFFANTGGYDLWSPDEPRYAEIARNIMLTGEPMQLVVNGEPYREKPPLFFWAIAAASWPFGDVSAATARFPSGLAAFLTVLLTYYLANRMYGPRAAFWAALILATNMRFWWQARWAQIDMVLTLFMVIALIALWWWQESRQRRWLVLLYAAMAAGLFAKGPPALIFPLLTILVYYRPYTETRHRTHWLLGSAIAAVPVFLWLWVSSAATGAPAHEEAGSNLFRQTIGRAVLGVSKAAPPWDYLISLPVDLMPWTLILPWVLIWAWRNRNRDEQTRFLLCWIVPAFILFSIMIGKRAIYLLPLFPAIAILMGQSMTALLDGPNRVWRERTLTALGVLLLAGAILLAVAYPFMGEYGDTWLAAAPALILVCGAMGAASLALRGRNEGRLLPGMIAGSFALIAVVASFTALPAMNVHKSVATIAAPIRALARTGAEFDLYSLGFSREGYTFYSERDHIAVFTGLVPFESPLSLAEKAALQKRLAKVMTEAALEVPIEDLAYITEHECEALRGAIELGVHENRLEDATARELRFAFERELDAFAEAFGSGRPAFLFAQEEDWRWFIGLTPEARAWPVLDHRAVGSRSVLLVANQAGYALLRATNPTLWPVS